MEVKTKGATGAYYLARSELMVSLIEVQTQLAHRALTYSPSEKREQFPSQAVTPHSYLAGVLRMVSRKLGLADICATHCRLGMMGRKGRAIDPPKSAMYIHSDQRQAGCRFDMIGSQGATQGTYYNIFSAPMPAVYRSQALKANMR